MEPKHHSEESLEAMSRLQLLEIAEEWCKFHQCTMMTLAGSNRPQKALLVEAIMECQEERGGS